MLFNSDIVNFVWKTDEGEIETIVFINICSLTGLKSSVDVGWWGWGRKSYLGPAEIASFSSRYFSQSNKYDIFLHVVLTRYFYVLFL